VEKEIAEKKNGENKDPKKDHQKCHRTDFYLLMMLCQHPFIIKFCYLNPLSNSTLNEGYFFQGGFSKIHQAY